MKKSLEKIIRMPLLESLSNDVFRYGTVVLVEFEAHSLWYEAAYTIAAQALRDGIKTDFHIFQHPPEDVKEALRRQGVNLDETRVLERFRIIDS